MIITQQHCMPKFLHDAAQALIYLIDGKDHYLLVWNDQKITKIMLLDSQDAQVIHQLIDFVEQAIDDRYLPIQSEQVLDYNSYMFHKHIHDSIARDCLKAKVCKKV